MIYFCLIQIFLLVHIVPIILFHIKEFHSFWRWLEKLASERKVLLLDSVYKEITHKNSKGQIDELGQWAEAIFSERQISHKTDEIGAAYAQVQDYLATCGCYRSASYAQWEPEDKADPWLIAAAKVLHATIVTNEQAVKPTRNQPLKREPKIPDVAEALGVRTMGLREFYDASGGLTHRAYPIQPAF